MKVFITNLGLCTTTRRIRRAKLRYLLIFGVILFAFNLSGCGIRKEALTEPQFMKGGDSEAFEMDTTRPSDFNERMRHICPF